MPIGDTVTVVERFSDVAVPRDEGTQISSRRNLPGVPQREPQSPATSGARCSSTLSPLCRSVQLDRTRPRRTRLPGGGPASCFRRADRGAGRGEALPGGTGRSAVRGGPPAGEREGGARPSGRSGTSCAGCTTSPRRRLRRVAPGEARPRGRAARRPGDAGPPSHVRRAQGRAGPELARHPGAFPPRPAPSRRRPRPTARPVTGVIRGSRFYPCRGGQGARRTPGRPRSSQPSSAPPCCTWCARSRRPRPRSHGCSMSTPRRLRDSWKPTRRSGAAPRPLRSPREACHGRSDGASFRPCP